MKTQMMGIWTIGPSSPITGYFTINKLSLYILEWKAIRITTGQHIPMKILMLRFISMR